ncbi:MAG: hypothetical protein K6U11_14770 [bacterium]|nr:hypothetical protein [bacterium]
MAIIPRLTNDAASSSIIINNQIEGAAHFPPLSSSVIIYLLSIFSDHYRTQFGGWREMAGIDTGIDKNVKKYVKRYKAGVRLAAKQPVSGYSG